MKPIGDSRHSSRASLREACDILWLVSSLDSTTKRANGIVMKDVLQLFAIGNHLFEKFLQSRAETDSLKISSLPVAARAIATEE